MVLGSLSMREHKLHCLNTRVRQRLHNTPAVKSVGVVVRNNKRLALFYHL